MRTIYRYLVLACALIIGWIGVQYAAEAMSRHDRSAAYFCIGAVAVVVACLIDHAIERRRA